MKQRDFVKITNSTEYYFKFFFNIEKDFEAEHNFLSIESNQQKELIVIKKQFQFLEYPYKSNCNNYKTSKSIFNSLSQKHCIRQCIRYYYEMRDNCTRFAFKNSINQMDYGFKNLNICEAFIDKNILIEGNERHSNVMLMKLTLSWDESKPFVTNREIPVMTFTDLFYYIGGLFGMWFGINANQIFIKLMENIYFHKVSEFFQLLFIAPILRFMNTNKINDQNLI